MKNLDHTIYGCLFGILCFSCSTNPQDSSHTPNYPVDSASQESSENPNHHTNDANLSESVETTQIASDFDNHQACFSSQNMLYEQDFVLSSVQTLTLNEERTAILLESVMGNIYLMLMNNQGEILSTKNIASLSQLSCAETIDNGFRIAIIERNPIKATYNLEVLAFDVDGVQMHDEDWSAKTRGFIPDPGSHCGFIGHRDMIVVGTRPRQDKPPYHGMFTLHSNALDMFNETNLHVPDIIEVYPSQGETRVLVKEVITDEEGHSEWPHILYRLDESGGMEQLKSADFIASNDEFAPGVTKTGCYMGVNGHSYCTTPEMELLEIVSLRGACGEYPEDACMQWIEPTHHWLVKMPAMEKPEAVMIPPDLYFFTYHLPGNSQIRLAADKKPNHPEIANHLRFVQIDPSCLW